MDSNCCRSSDSGKAKGAIYTFAMLILTVWLMLMGAGGLCYPRKPLATGVLFISAGAFMLTVWSAGLIGNAPPIIAATSVALGFSQLWRFRDSSVRAAHVAGWTGKA
jgi:hypothetical protein